MPEFKKDPDELGVLWERTSSRGTYMTGNVNGQAVVVFKNDRKVAGSKQPDWKIMKPKAKADPAHVTDEDFL